MKIKSLNYRSILIFSLFLIVNYLSKVNAQTTYSTQYISTCKQYIWPINGKTYTGSGTFKDTIPNVKNFDSIITLNLTIYPAKSTTVTVSECSKYTWSANGLTYSQSGIYKT